MADATSPSNINQQIATDFQNNKESFVPRLRWTPGIKIKDTDLEDSSELYDSTSGSTDEYDSDTSYESEDTDANLKPNLGENWQFATDLWNEPFSFSPPFCDTTTSDMTFDRGTITSEVWGADESRSHQDTNDSIVVSVSKKKKGNRVYDKRHYCLYCSKPYAKMARHLETAHATKADVVKAVGFPKGSKERKKALDYIRNKGNYAHNAAIMEAGKGELVPCKRPPKEAQGIDFMHCAYCQGLFTRKVLWRHMQTCKLKPGSVGPKPGKNRVQSLCTYTAPVPLKVNQQLWKVISAMNPDPVTDIIKNDNVILDLGQHLLNKGGMSANNQLYVREKMREMGRLIHSARRVTTLQAMEDFIHPEKYSEIVKAVQITCGYDGDTKKFVTPSLAIKLGNALVKVSKFLKAQGLISNNRELVKNASEFQEIHNEKWNEMVSATALRNIAEAKWNVPTLMPFTEDVQKMHHFLGQMQDECSNALSKSPSVKAWIDLTKVCLTQTILFNRCREVHVESMPLSAFLSRDSSDSHQDVDWALTEVEKRFCRHFTRIVIRGKEGRPLPILLTPKMLCALELLVMHRETCGVLKDNSHMFARPRAMTHFRGSECLRGVAKACGAKCPKSLTSTKLRKHAATISAVLNMTDAEMEQVANFLGHDIRIHGELYQLPEKTLRLAKLSKVLMALERGRFAEFHGKNLDEITVDPDEKVLVCDEEDGSRKEGHCSSVDDMLAERNEVPPPPKRCKPQSAADEESPGVSAEKPSTKNLPRGEHPGSRRKCRQWRGT
uniref:uncharacterized protein LOC109966462 isoform X2 n=1 Tax=Monopterus albus TaxID=43700 RepID=UPI0009B48F0E|nr:uncharacterized protein LOC109966462 isoform X2 [Monopterus albus]